ncbi:MAG: hypothetical protein QXT66_02760 [Nitrososphaerota archaeon]
MVEISNLLGRLTMLGDREMAIIATHTGLQISLPRERLVREIGEMAMREESPLTWFVRLLVKTLPDKTVKKLLGYEESREKLLEKLAARVGRGMKAYRDVSVDMLRADIILYSSEIGSYGSLVPAPEIKHSITVVTCVKEPVEVEDRIGRAMRFEGYVDRIYLGANTYAVLVHLAQRRVEWLEFMEHLNSMDIGLVRLDRGGETVVDRQAGVRGFDTERYMRLLDVLTSSKPFKRL